MHELVFARDGQGRFEHQAAHFRLLIRGMLPEPWKTPEALDRRLRAALPCARGLDAPRHGRPPRGAGERALRVRARAAVRPEPADRVPPSPDPARGRHPLRRAPRDLGLLLARARRARAAARLRTAACPLTFFSPL